MKNRTWIVKQWAVAYIAPADFACPVLPANPTEADYTTAINAIETAVASSTDPLSFQKWAYLMVETATLTEEYADVRSVKLACGEEYCKTAKPKISVALNVMNAADPYLMQILTGVKNVEWATWAFYASQKITCRPLPQMVVKIVTCPDENNKVNIYYYLPATLNGSMVTKFQDYCENDFEWSELTLDVSSGGCVIKKVETFDPSLNEDPTTT